MDSKDREELKAKQMKLLKELALITGIDVTKEDNNKNIDDKEEEMEKRFKIYIQAFEEEFETNSQERLKQAPLLIRMYRDMSEKIYAPSKRYNLAIQTMSEIDKKLEKILTAEQKNLLSQKRYCENIIADDVIEMSFVWGYCIADELKEESKEINIKNKSKKE